MHRRISRHQARKIHRGGRNSCTGKENAKGRHSQEGEPNPGINSPFCSDPAEVKNGLRGQMIRGLKKPFPRERGVLFPLS
jgi:hypothetical protein